MRINVGCGQTPTQGWRNFDGSPSLRLARIPLLPNFLYRTGLLQPEQYKFIRFVQDHHIEFGNVTTGLPLPDHSVEVLYSSHMLEHLDHTDVILFLQEAKRVLCPGGIIRLAVPDIEILVQQYLESKDADVFMSESFLTELRPRSLAQRLKSVFTTISQQHRWMYDGRSLCKLLEEHGFVDASVMPVGKTRIQNPESLDLAERASESVYVEAQSPFD